MDWVIGAFLGVVGILVTLAGTALHYGVTRPDVAELVHNSEFQSDVLTEAEAIDVLVALGQWSGVGLAIGGVLLVLFGIAVVIAHRRARTNDQTTPSWILGVVGALVGSILSFIPFSPVLGGAVAAYLDPRHEASALGTGALAGVFASLPLLVVAVFAAIGLFMGAPANVVTAVVPILAAALFAGLLYLVGLSALGGYLGRWLRGR